MKTIILNKKVIKLYDSIDEMPIINFQKYNKYLLIDSGVGSDVDDLNSHIVKVAQAIKAGDNKKALLELQNMQQNIAMVNSEISPRYLAFAALIHSIDGKELVDLSDEGLRETLNNIKEIRHSKLADFLVWLKKKVSSELEAYFPGDFSSAKEKEVYDKIKQRTILVLTSITDKIDNSEAINAIDLALFNIYKPKSFIGSDSVEIQYDKQFENACVLIAQKTSLDAKRMKVLQFYSTLDTIKRQAEAEARSYKSIKK